MSIAFIQADIENCIKVIDGNGTEIISTISHQPSQHKGKLVRSISKSSFQRLQIKVGQSEQQLWLNDEVNSSFLVISLHHKQPLCGMFSRLSMDTAC